MPLSRTMDVEKQLEEEFPDSKDYALCQMGAFKSGVFTAVTGGVVAISGQLAVGRRLPWGTNRAMTVATVVAVGAGWVASYNKTKECQRLYKTDSDDSERLKSLAEESGAAVQSTEVASNTPEEPPLRPPPTRTNQYGDPIE